MKIYVVRHGQTNINELGYHGTENDDLTDLGISEAKELVDKLKNINFDLIICSPMIRTKHTCEILNINKIPVIYDDRIKERNAGNLSGKSRENENREEYWNYYSTIQYGTSENIKHFFERVYDFLDELKTKNYKNVLIVTHSGVSKAFNGYFYGIKDGKFLKRGLKNCEIKVYEL